MIVERHRGTAAELHGLEMPDDGQRRVWHLAVSEPAVVLGSTQADDVVDAAVARDRGVEVARRRSGGGAVWVAPDDTIWLDVLIPRDDPAWDDDVGRSFLPIGRAWSTALEVVGVAGTRVHEGPLVRTVWSEAVCFAGIGPGEVLLGDAKVVGISQRRTRAGARFQCAVPRTWDPEPLRSLLVPPPPVVELADLATGVGPVDLDALVEALVAALV
ncbi:MAG: hypothetical protein U5K30_01145 [Acidimicrobiales bacterium]|nr:hypothetical protein [Acidimicrobiales bacterium]